MNQPDPPASVPEQAPPELQPSAAQAPAGGAPLGAPVGLPGQRCGLVAIVGKPNVGKSTLLNALVGQKISITSRKAQTTRHRITGIRSEGLAQFIFVDTPGFQTRHNNALNRSLNKTVLGAVGDVDLVLFVVEAGSFALADAKVLALLRPGSRVLLIANKLDKVHRRGELAPWLKSMQERYPFTEFVPLSAKNPKDVALMVLLPLIRSKVDVPIVAAGGIVCGRTMAAAFALGAEAVQMGTRMVSAAAIRSCTDRRLIRSCSRSRA